MKQFSLMASVASLCLCSAVSAAANREGVDNDQGDSKMVSINNGFGITGSGSASSRDHRSTVSREDGSNVTSIYDGLDHAPGGASPPSSRRPGHTMSSSHVTAAAAPSPRLSPATAGF